MGGCQAIVVEGRQYLHPASTLVTGWLYAVFTGLTGCRERLSGVLLHAPHLDIELAPCECTQAEYFAARSCTPVPQLFPCRPQPCLWAHTRVPAGAWHAAAHELCAQARQRFWVGLGPRVCTLWAARRRLPHRLHRAAAAGWVEGRGKRGASTVRACAGQGCTDSTALLPALHGISTLTQMIVGDVCDMQVPLLLLC